MTYVVYDVRGFGLVLGVTEHVAKNFDGAAEMQCTRQHEMILHFVDNKQHHEPIVQLGLE